ncbi:Fc receptor-like protein 2 [Mustelus asterias]
MATQANEPEVVIAYPRNGIIKEGSQFQLKCRYNGKIIPAYWYQNEEFIIFRREKMYSAYAYSNSGGSYQCGVHTFYSYIKSKPLDLIIVVSDKTLTLEIMPQYPLFGDNIVLKCLTKSWALRGYTFQWYQNNAFISEYDESQITIGGAKYSDEGTYRCELRKDYVKWISNDVELTVKDLCSTPVLKVDPDVEVFVGQRLNFTCSAEKLQAHYLLLSSFLKNKQTLDIPKEQDYYVIETAVLADSGSYRCEVTSSKSIQKKFSDALTVLVKLIPVSKPNLEIQPRSEIIEGETASLICSVPSGSTPISYVFYNNLTKEIYWENSNHSRIIYSIVNVRKNDEGNYSCRVSNLASEMALYSESKPLAVIVPVAGASLTSNANKTECSIGDRLVLQCQLKEGTSPQFLWYLNHQQLGSISEYYNFSTDGSQLNIHSFQIHDKGQYHCVATNRGPDEVTFNTSSNYVDIEVPEQSHATAITTSVIPLLLIAALFAYLCFKQRITKQDTPSRISQQQGDASGNRTPNTSDVTPARDFEYAVVGTCRNTDSSCIKGTNFAEDGTKTDAELVYSVVTITKSRGTVNSGGRSTGKQDNKEGENDYCITYATLNHIKNEDSFERYQKEEGCFYENLPRHS